MRGARVDTGTDTETLRKSEEHQAFLLKLSDTVRPLAEPAGIIGVACRLLGEYLGAQRVSYADIEGDHYHIRQGYVAGVAPLPQRGKRIDFGRSLLAAYHRGEPVAVADVSTDPRLTDEERARYARFEIGAVVGFMLIKSGTWVAAFSVQCSRPHDWTAGEVGVIREVAERLWSAIERAKAETALRESEARYRRLFEAMDQGFAVCEMIRDRRGRAVDFIWLVCNSALLNLSGLRREELIGRRASEFAAREAKWWVRTYDGVLRSGKVKRFGEGIEILGRTWDLTVFPHGPDQVAVLHDDITERKRAEAVLRQRESELARVQRIGAVGGYHFDLDSMTGRLSPEYRRLHGLPPDTDAELRGDWLKRVHPDDRPRTERILRDVLTGRSDVYENEYRILRPSDGAVRWISARGDILRDPAGRPIRIVGADVDVTEQKRMQERQQVLVAELQHRTRNIIGIVSAISKQTMAITGPTEAFQEAFAERLSALARVQDLLSRGDDAPITIDQLVRMELDALGVTGTLQSRVTLEGQALPMRASSVQALALALHELATNARKYGALTDAGGRLRIAWRVEQDQAGARQLRLTWTEEDTTPPRASRRRSGYGRQLIERALPYTLGARTALEIHGCGIRCLIEIPYDKIVSA